MTEVVIATVLLGSAYLISNKKKENFEDIHNRPLLSIQTTPIKPMLAPKPTTLHTSVEKYFPNEKNNVNSNFSHNNMTPFYKNNSYGHHSFTNDQRLDTYTGSGSNTIVKQELGTLFKPQDNLQNVYGAQNENDFLQSRVNESKRHANTKPWEEIRVGPGDLGFNSGVQHRDSTQPKTVDQLRTANNPKSSYELNYQAPAYKPTESQRGELGKTVKKTPDTYFVNDGIGGMGPAYGMEKPAPKSQQMMTHENREDTSVMYYGTRGVNTNTYVDGEHHESKKQQLPTQPYTNLSSQSVFHVADHGLNSFNILENNRSSKQDYFGNIKSQVVANTVMPIINQLKPTRKGTEESHPGFLGGTSKQPIVYNPYEQAPTTQREMMSESKPHYNVQGSAMSYIHTNPYLAKTQRQTTSHSVLGNAGGISANKSYDSVYAQRNIQKPFENRAPNGNITLYNGNMQACIKGHEKTNDRAQAFYAPTNDTPHILGVMTKQTQKYELPVMDNSLLKAFKENPYTHSLSSVA